MRGIVSKVQKPENHLKFSCKMLWIIQISHYTHTKHDVLRSFLGISSFLNHKIFVLTKSVMMRWPKSFTHPPDDHVMLEKVPITQKLKLHSNWRRGQLKDHLFYFKKFISAFRM